MGRALINLPESAKSRLLTAGFEDDFERLDPNRWNTIESDDNASVAIDADGVNGVVQLNVSTDDNEEAYLYTNEIALIAAGKPIIVLARVQYTEANADDANILFGLMDGWAANQLLDGGGGPKASFDGACIYKVDGETRFRVRSSNGATNKDEQTDVTAGGSTYQTLAIEITPQPSGNAEVIFWIDPSGGNTLEQVRAYQSHPRTPLIKHEVSLTGQSELALGFGIKNGAANSESLNVDLAVFYKTR